MTLTLALAGLFQQTKDEDKKKEGDFIQLIFKLLENKIISITNSHLAWEAASCRRSYLFWEEYHSAEKAFDVRVWWVPAKCWAGQFSDQIEGKQWASCVSALERNDTTYLVVVYQQLKLQKFSISCSPFLFKKHFFV